MKVAIMQPYVFPYIGYFQLIQAVDTFVFYDDVHFKKKGFINRNSILVNGKSNMFTIPCKAISQNKLINEHQINFDLPAKLKFLNTLKHAYSKAPYFDNVYPLIETFLLTIADTTISNFAIESVKLSSKYMDLKKQWVISSESHGATKGMGKADRLISISKNERADTYVNVIHGNTLYNKGYFENQEISLKFLKPKIVKYKQFDFNFAPNLSIIDVMMFNSKKDIYDLLNQVELE